MRKEKSLKNFFTNIIPYIILTVLGFFRLKVLLNQLGVEIYALNQLFIQIFAYISLAEAGIGTLITQQYYKCFVDNNREKINQIYSSSQKLLRIVSYIMLGAGIIISFSLKLLTHNSLSLWYMQLLFMLYLFRSVMEYFMFAPRFILIADQKSYKINLLLNIYKILEILVEVSILTFYKNYAVILISSIIIRFISYYYANKKAFKEYPWLHTVDKTIKISGMTSVILHKIAGTVYSNTDVLLVSAFLSPIEVTIYSSYNYIIKFINDLIYMLASAMTASMGNVLYKDDLENQNIIFEKINSVFIFLAMSLCVPLYWSINSFITLWIGQDKIMEPTALIIMILTLYTSITSRPFLLIRDARALYKESKIIAISEAAINLILSIVFIKFMGITGVVLATLIATLFTTDIFYPILIYKRILKKPSAPYFIKLVLSIIFSILLCYLGSYAKIILNVNNYVSWFLFSIIYGIISLFIIFLFNYTLFKSFREFFNELYTSIIHKFQLILKKGIN